MYEPRSTRTPGTGAMKARRVPGPVTTTPTAKWHVNSIPEAPHAQPQAQPLLPEGSCSLDFEHHKAWLLGFELYVDGIIQLGVLLCLPLFTQSHVCEIHQGGRFSEQLLHLQSGCAGYPPSACVSVECSSSQATLCGQSFFIFFKDWP